ncbi:putative short chain oxidoreductase/dehydrogenase [Aspergillus uvarum CBS 121591]|uniref:Putative short chain oxidoreductase/dehydrogenase n=1 Tax=Aspergillus uvarum CBS 121591 TaxID=1448315 RepID=A0A319DCC3_9EURO|nr:putative short chain oxidoreductase/dehydrogenase [Aspergillus uvarum CBS 121591]PYH77492.1 putative short chain oxidoreductase/dehydrogenase [Aspergillus uvarum CBS 121591]
MTLTAPKVWLITGCSAGFGISIARTVLAKGHYVIASSRNPSKSPELVDEITSKGGKWIALDVTSPEETVKKTIEEATAIHGRLDVVVNNAGYALVGSVEDSKLSNVQAQFETNVFGVLKVIKAVLPSMRAAQSGIIVNISSTGGLRSLPAVSMYAATKHAVEAISESLSLEVQSFGIRILLVEPGPFRTNFLGRGAVKFSPATEVYRNTAVGKVIQHLQDEDGKQPGDPAKAAERIFEVVTGEGMAKDKKQYLRLVLGRKAFDSAQGKIDMLQENLTALEDITKSADFDS